jgi:hypothetical protein
MKSTVMRIVVPLVLIATLLLSHNASAQSGVNIRVNMVTTLEREESMLLKIYFSFFDEREGIPIINAEPKSAHLTFLNTKLEAEANIKKPDIPIYISLVMDGSGSMSPAVLDVQKAAVQALDNIPDRSLFSVIKFDESIVTLQDFVENVNTVQFAITERYKSELNKGTCLYDAGYAAVEALAKAPAGRRALILFTDGVDEKYGESGRCSKHSYDELVTFAYKSQVPINTIGLTTGQINAVELKNMASSTGGYAVIGGKGDLSGMFQQIMDALRSQWMVEVDAWPKNGQQDVVLRVLIQGQDAMTTTVTFQSQKEYAGPPSPVTARILGFTFNEDTQTCSLQLDLTQPELIKRVVISLWDAKSNAKIDETVFDNVAPQGLFSISGQKVQNNGDYQLKVTIYDKNDKPFAITKGDKDTDAETLVHEFKAEFKQTQMTILSIQLLEDDAVIKIDVKNGEKVGKYEGWLVVDGTNNQVPNSNFTETKLAEDGSITISLDERDIPAGKYNVILLAKDKNEQILTQTELKGFIYTPYVKSLIEIVFGVFTDHPIILLPIISVILAVIGFLMFTAFREKSMTGTPVMQGGFGKIKGKGGGFELPVNKVEELPRPQIPPPLAVPSRSSPPLPTPAPDIQPVKKAEISSTPDEEKTLMGFNEPATARFSQARLKVECQEDPSVNGKTFLIDRDPYIIGREDVCELTIKDNNVSRQHARITLIKSTGYYAITDQKSSNGTRVSGTLLAPDTLATLADGAVIQLGPNVRITFELNQ